MQVSAAFKARWRRRRLGGEVVRRAEKGRTCLDLRSQSATREKLNERIVCARDRTQNRIRSPRLASSGRTALSELGNSAKWTRTFGTRVGSAGRVDRSVGRLARMIGWAGGVRSFSGLTVIRTRCVGGLFGGRCLSGHAFVGRTVGFERPLWSRH